MTILYQNNFDAETSGTLPSGWVNKVGTAIATNLRPVSGTLALAFSTGGDGAVALYTGISAAADMEVQSDHLALVNGTHFPNIGHIMRMDAAYNNGYAVLLISTDGATYSIIVFKRTSGSFSQIGVTTASGLSVVAGDTVHVATRIVGTAISVFLWKNANARPGTANYALTDASVSAAGYAGVYNTLDTTTSVPSLDNFVITDAAAGATVPGAPTIGTATAGNASASVSFTAPGSNGGATITGYTATSSPGGFTGTVSSVTPITVAGLTNGTAYTFTVTATNSAGTGAASVASNSVTPAAVVTVPSAPTIGTAAGGNAQATVTFSTPSSDGGSVITGYTATSSPGALTGAVSGATASPITVAGLTNGTAYTFTVKAMNAIGQSAASAASNSVTPAVGAIYTRVDATDTVYGNSIMVLVPNSSASIPYNSANPTGVILYAHGMAEDQTGLATDSLKTATVTALLNAGYILAGTNAAGFNFGSQAGVDAYSALAKYVKDNYNVSNICLWSQSMGGLAGLNAIAQNKIPGLVGWLGTYPMCSLSANYTSAGGTDFSSSINAAFGITGSGIATYANKTYGNDAVLKPAVAFRHLPMRFYTSAADTVVKKSFHTDVMQPIIAGSCRESVVVVCTGDHGDPTHFQPSDYVAFFARCFATPVGTSGSLAAITPTTTKTISVTFQTKAGTLQANLTGLSWEWCDVLGTVIDSGTGATTNSSGVFSVTSVHTNLSAGGVGFLKVKNGINTVSTSDVSGFGAVAVS